MRSKQFTICTAFARASTTYVGTANQPKDTRDKFGPLYKGQVRTCHIETVWGQLRVPFECMNKPIRIIVKAG